MTKTKKSKAYYAYLEAWISIFVNTLLFGLKYWAGIVSGSVAIIADAWHTLSDSISSVIVIFGTRAANKPADDEHPFGHGRSELIASLIIGVFLSLVAFNFLIESIGRLRNHESAQYGIVATIVIVVSILLKEFLAQIAFWTGRKSNNPALKADGWHHRSDALSSVVVLIGILVSKHFWWIDGALGIAVAVMLFYASYEILKESINPLLGEEPGSELLKKIIKIGNDAAGMEVFIHHIHLHKYGDHTELTFHIRLPNNMSIQEAHSISSAIEEKIRKELDIYSTIHFDPIRTNV
jgi:cation diffusion facilitator family transporter